MTSESGRKSKPVTVPKFSTGHNRDFGKTFVITEWPAARAEDWGMRMMFAFNRGGGQIPMGLDHVGMEGIAIIGINTFLRGNIEPDEMIPLLNELLDCVEIVRDPKHPEVTTKIVSEDDIAEISTRMWLRSEVVELHTGFSVAVALSKLATAIMAPKKADSPTM
jgi:hypothetical protein